LLAHFEEVLVGVFASRVVRVHVILLFLIYRFLDIPEMVCRDGSKDLESCRSLETLAESVLHILYVVVLLTLFENRKLLIKIIVPFV
jgi:hypothetical protein